MAGARFVCAQVGFVRTASLCTQEISGQRKRVLLVNRVEPIRFRSRKFIQIIRIEVRVPLRQRIFLIEALQVPVHLHVLRGTQTITDQPKRVLLVSQVDSDREIQISSRKFIQLITLELCFAHRFQLRMCNVHGQRHSAHRRL